MTQLEAAKQGKVTAEMEEVARQEGLAVGDILGGVRDGTIVIPRNVNHQGLEPRGIGKGLRTKVNANLGTSTDFPDVGLELEKLAVALEAGADTVMDLSTGGEIAEIRKALLGRCSLPFGTVPIYEAALKAVSKSGGIVKLREEELFGVIEEQAKDGVDFMTVHCGVTLGVLKRLRGQGRLTDMVSRGGVFLTCWMVANDKENPLFEHYDKVLEIAKKYDVTLSLGDGLRPGSIADATDRAQIEELIVIGELVDRARSVGVQVMVEGPGHLPLDQVEANVKVAKQVCKGAPFYVLGPLVTDVAPGYDHISGAIGGALAAWYGADFLCYVTPSEHLGLPDADDVRDGVIAARIAAHAADLVKGVKGAWEWDRELSRARKGLDWKRQIQLAIDPEKAKEYRRRRKTKTVDACSMCGEYCAMKLVREYLERRGG